MSKEVVIEIAGVAQNYTLDILRTKNIDGGSIDWVPEDDVQLTSLTVTENATYTPSGTVYGFSNVTVNTTGQQVSGYIDGVHYVVTLDSNGNLVFTPD